MLFFFNKMYIRILFLVIIVNFYFKFEVATYLLLLRCASLLVYTNKHLAIKHVLAVGDHQLTIVSLVLDV